MTHPGSPGHCATNHFARRKYNYPKPPIYLVVFLGDGNVNVHRTDGSDLLMPASALPGYLRQEYRAPTFIDDLAYWAGQSLWRWRVAVIGLWGANSSLLALACIGLFWFYTSAANTMPPWLFWPMWAVFTLDVCRNLTKHVKKWWRVHQTKRNSTHD